MEDPMIERAMKDWENVSADPQLRELYFDRRKAVMDRLAAAREAELREQRAEVRGEAKGKALMAQDVICQYLEDYFGTESQDLQRAVQMINDLDRLNQSVFLRPRA